MSLDSQKEAQYTRYWKWIGLHDEVWGVFRLNGFTFQKFRNGAWQQSDFLMRVSEDPDFIEVTEDEALEHVDRFDQLWKGIPPN